MKFSVFIGLLIAFGGLIAGYLLEGGVLQSLVLLSPFLIVFCGTWGATIMSYGLNGTLAAFRAFAQSLSKKEYSDPEKLIKILSDMSEKCRRGGLLALQEIMNSNELEDDQYLLLKEGMILAMDMKNSEEMRDVLGANIQAYATKRQLEISVFEGAGGFSPTLGIIGTVMGLVEVLSHIESAEKLAGAIAVAFIATLYGVVFANLIYLPMANKLKTDLKRRKIFMQMMVDGISLVASGESPRNLENKLSLYYLAFPNCEKKYKEGINN